MSKLEGSAFGAPEQVGSDSAASLSAGAELDAAWATIIPIAGAPDESRGTGMRRSIPVR